MTSKSITGNYFIHNRLTTHLDKLTQTYSKLLPIRIDLHYSLDDNKACSITDKQAVKHILDLTEQALKKIWSLVGFVWVMEISDNGNIHFHTFFYVNGQNTQKYYPIYQQIDSLWLSIVNNNGYTHDCNKNKKSYKYQALNMLKHNDKQALNKISYVLLYMAKEEQKGSIEDQYKFGLSKVPEHSGRGRPRKE